METVARRREETAPENALASTGPVSAEGKRASSQNAVKHGLRSSRAVLPDEDPGPFESFRMILVGDLMPIGLEEELLAEKIAVCHWKERRAARMEEELFLPAFSREGGPGETPLADSLRERGREFGLMLRYAAQNSRELARARKEFKALQEARRARAAADPIGPLPELESLYEGAEAEGAGAEGAGDAGDGDGVLRVNGRTYEEYQELSRQMCQEITGTDHAGVPPMTRREFDAMARTPQTARWSPEEHAKAIAEMERNLLALEAEAAAREARGAR